MTLHLTAAVTAHREGRLLRPTLRSVEAALRLVIEQGHECELLVVLDNASGATTAEAQRWAERDDLPFAVRLSAVSLGESGASRNHAVQQANGEFLAIVDGDDLVLANYFVQAIDAVREAEGEVVAHPEVVVSFGDRTSIWEVLSQRSPGFNYRALLDSNPWPSSSVSRRSVYLDHPFLQLSPAAGFGPEDYAWQIQSVIEGVEHITAPKTAFFYRARNKGGVNNSHASSVPAPFDLDALRRALPAEETGPASAPTLRSRVLRQVRRLASWLTRIGLRRFIGRLARVFLSTAMRRAIKSRLRVVYLRWINPSAGANARKVKRIASRLRATGMLRDVALIEPALTQALWRLGSLELWRAPGGDYSLVFEETVDALVGVDTLILAPWLGVGGADLVTKNYAESLAKQAGAGKVALLTTYLPERTLHHLIPPGVKHHQLSPQFRLWPTDQQQRFMAHLLTMLGPRVIISINCFDLTTSMREYALQIGSTSKAYVSLFAWDLVGAEGYPTNPITDDPHRTFLDHIAGILTDNTVTARRIIDTLGVDQALVKVHRQHGGLEADDFESVVSRTAAFEDSTIDADRPLRVLWPHRIDNEKRPDAVVRIAQKLKESGAPVEIHVYGQRVLHTTGADPVEQMQKAGVIYHGPYVGGLQSLDTENYHAVLLTSESEGLPLVLVQAMLLGLPVVSSNVGGVGDIVTHGETGLLADGPEDIDGFVAALLDLASSQELRQRLIRGGYDKAAALHTPTVFAKVAREEFGTPASS